MPQVFGADSIDLIYTASNSLWAEAASERDIEKATHPLVATEARSRGLVPLRMGSDPIWHHPESGKIVTLTPFHSGESVAYTSIQNLMAKLRREYPTPEETAKANRTPEQIEAEQAAAANETRTKKQQAVDAAKRKREQEAAKAFKVDHAPFKNMDEVQRAFDARSDAVKASRPGDTVEQLAGRLRALPAEHRQKVHQMVFPERYKIPRPRSGQ